MKLWAESFKTPMIDTFTHRKKVNLKRLIFTITYQLIAVVYEHPLEKMPN